MCDITIIFRPFYFISSQINSEIAASSREDRSLSTQPYSAYILQSVIWKFYGLGALPEKSDNCKFLTKFLTALMSLAFSVQHILIGRANFL